jgi:hypothetical protein
VYPVSGNKPLSLRLKKESAYTYEYLGVNKMYIIYYKVIINDCPIAVRIGDVVECAVSLITWVRLVSLIGGATGDSGNLSTSLTNVARLAAHSKFVWVFNANYDGTIIYNDPVLVQVFCFHN